MRNRNVFFRAVLAMLMAVSVVLGASPATADETTGKPELFTSGEYRYFVNEAGNASIYAYDGSESELTIPSALDGHPVTDIGKGAFLIKDELTSAVIPDSVTSIGVNAFYGCFRLQAIEVSENNPCFSCLRRIV